MRSLRTRIVLPGGTKFTCHESTLFSEAILAIRRTCLEGGHSSFAAIIQRCTRDLDNYIREVVRRRRREQKPPVFFLLGNMEADFESNDDAQKRIVNEDKSDNERPNSMGTIST